MLETKEEILLTNWYKVTISFSRCYYVSFEMINCKEIGIFDATI